MRRWAITRFVVAGRHDSHLRSQLLSALPSEDRRQWSRCTADYTHTIGGDSVLRSAHARVGLNDFAGLVVSGWASRFTDRSRRFFSGPSLRKRGPLPGLFSVRNGGALIRHAEVSPSPFLFSSRPNFSPLTKSRPLVTTITSCRLPSQL